MTTNQVLISAKGTPLAEFMLIYEQLQSGPHGLSRPLVARFTFLPTNFQIRKAKAETSNIIAIIVCMINQTYFFINTTID